MVILCQFWTVYCDSFTKRKDTGTRKQIRNLQTSSLAYLQLLVTSLTISHLICAKHPTIVTQFIVPFYFFCYLTTRLKSQLLQCQLQWKLCTDYHRKDINRSRIHIGSNYVHKVIDHRQGCYRGAGLNLYDTGIPGTLRGGKIIVSLMLIICAFK